jgi:hypothetical protein
MLAPQICQRKLKLLPLSERVKTLNLIRKEKSPMLQLPKPMIRTNPLREIVKEKEISGSFTVASQTAKVMATAAKC